MHRPRNPPFSERLGVNWVSLDPELAKIVAAWPTLPDPIRRAMLALTVDRGTEADGLHLAIPRRGVPVAADPPRPEGDGGVAGGWITDGDRPRKLLNPWPNGSTATPANTAPAPSTTSGKSIPRGDS